MIKERVLRLKEDAKAPFNIELKKFSEIEIVQDVIYMNGYILQPEMQPAMYNFILKNPNLFVDVTKKW